MHGRSQSTHHIQRRSWLWKLLQKPSPLNRGSCLCSGCRCLFAVLVLITIFIVTSSPTQILPNWVRVGRHEECTAIPCMGWTVITHHTHTSLLADRKCVQCTPNLHFGLIVGSGLCAQTAQHPWAHHTRHGHTYTDKSQLLLTLFAACWSVLC